MKIRIGTRGSKLALWQANYIQSLIEGAAPGVTVELVVIKTSGDIIQDTSLTEIGGKGLFVKEIEKSLLAKETDLAVHSMKDMPAEIPDGLSIAATPPAELPWDALIFGRQATLQGLAPGAVIGTTSLRRIVQLKRIKPGLKFDMLRGNVDTRIRKLKAGQFDAIVIAYAGMNRLGIKPGFTEKLDIIPAAGQGIIAVEARDDAAEVREVMEKINHRQTFIRAQAERGFVTRLGGSCDVPAGAYARLTDNGIDMNGFVANPEGDRFCEARVTGKPEQAYDTGIRLAEELLALGASEILTTKNTLGK